MKEESRSRRILLFGVLVAAFLLAVGSTKGIEGAMKGLKLAVYHVLPPTFPFLVLSEMAGGLLTGRGGRKGLLSAFFAGNLSGYPAGGRLTGSLIKEEKSDALSRVLLSVACVGAGPGFTLSAVGAGILGSPGAGRVLYAAQLLTSLTALIPLLIRTKTTSFPSETPVKSTPFTSLFVASVQGSCLAMLYIGGYVVLFSCLLGILEGAVPLGGLPGMAAAGLLEISAGCGRSTLSYGGGGMALLGGLLGFGGLSVFFQLAALTGDSGLTLKELFLSRLLAGLLGGGFAYLLYLLFPSACATVAFEPTLHPQSCHSAALALPLCLLTAVVLLCDRRTADLRLSLSRKG